MKLNEENKEKQKRLRELHEVKSSKAEAASGSSKDTASHKRKAADSSAPRAQKRSRETASTPAPLSAVETEEEWVKRPEIKLDVPDILKVQLVDDWEAITKNGQVRTYYFFGSNVFRPLTMMPDSWSHCQGHQMWKPYWHNIFISTRGPKCSCDAH